MYYYILESPSNRAIRQTYQRLRDILTNLGIAGEMVASSPARAPEELAAMGIEKGYSTIVAVGGDYHIHRVATTVMNRAALGIVPISASEQVTGLLGVKDLRGAAETLKHRRLTLVSTVLIDPGTPLFLEARIAPPKLAKVSLVIDNKVKAFAYFNQASVNRELEVRLESSHLTEPRKVMGLFQVGGNVIKSESLFHGRTVRIVTDPELPLLVAGHQVATTPVQLRLLPGSLKVITRRGTVL
jgi:diacylglycerol kinase family enzyme